MCIRDSKTGVCKRNVDAKSDCVLKVSDVHCRKFHKQVDPLILFTSNLFSTSLMLPRRAEMYLFTLWTWKVYHKSISTTYSPCSIHMLLVGQLIRCIITFVITQYGVCSVENFFCTVQLLFLEFINSFI